jgi:hypothetical protein
LLKATTEQETDIGYKKMRALTEIVSPGDAAYD